MDDVPLYDVLSSDYDLMVDWAGRLAAEWPFFEAVFARAGITNQRQQRVLDVGCGTGQHAVHFARQGREVVGADPSAAMLAKAVANAKGTKGVVFVRAGFGELRDNVDGEFDVVTCLGNTLPHVTDPAALFRAIEDMAAMLRPDGLLIVQQLNYDRIYATRQRFLGVNAGKDNPNILFFRFYDFLDPLLRFNVVRFRRSQEGSWAFTADETMLRPALKAELAKTLAVVGFSIVDYYGGLHFVQFDDQSNDLVFVATKK